MDIFIFCSKLGKFEAGQIFHFHELCFAYDESQAATELLSEVGSNLAVVDQNCIL